MLKKNTILYSPLSPFRMHIRYVDLPTGTVEKFGPHIHSECEVCINLSGDISFVVENNIYPISPGDIIITRPSEYHHCIYHSDAPHRHFWILISPEENHALLRLFFDRNAGENNLLRLSAENTEQLISLCHTLVTESGTPCEQLLRFFTLLALLESARPSAPLASSAAVPAALVSALGYIESNLSHPISMEELANATNVSVNTLERHFSRSMRITPTAFIRQKKLLFAQKLLRNGHTVQEACEQSGFSDYSHFIALFKKNFGITPLQYKKQFSCI